jgi:hypothetical protein
MRLEHVCDIELVYTSRLVIVRPYGSEEGAGYGEGEGTVTGERLQGTVRWTNHPRRRGDGMSLADAHGIILTHDGARIVFALAGRAVFGERGRGGQLLSALFESDDERYLWLNDSFCVLEGAIDNQRPGMRAHVYNCINELV